MQKYRNHKNSQSNKLKNYFFEKSGLLYFSTEELVIENLSGLKRKSPLGHSPWVKEHWVHSPIIFFEISSKDKIMFKFIIELKLNKQKIWVEKILSFQNRPPSFYTPSFPFHIRKPFFQDSRSGNEVLFFFVYFIRKLQL